MGLDMYLNGRVYLCDEIRKIKDKDLGFLLCENVYEIAYWRKHPNLHGFIVNTFADGVDECQEIELTAENCFEVIKAITVFGSSCDDEESKAQDIKTFANAAAWLDKQKKGEFRSVIYRASW